MMVECIHCGEPIQVPGCYDEGIVTAVCSKECWEASQL